MSDDGNVTLEDWKEIQKHIHRTREGAYRQMAEHIKRLEAENERLQKAAKELVEFVDYPAEAQRPDVWRLRVNALRRALEEDSDE